MDELYTLENAQKFNWSSITGDLNPERVSHLEKYLTGQKILDAGCGGGAYVKFLAGKGLDVTGCDKYDEFLEVAQAQHRSGRYVKGDVTALDFPDETFDCTYCFDVLEHVDDRAAIRELARVTKQRLILAVPREDEDLSRFNVTFLHYQDKTHLRNYTVDSLEDLASLTGYERLHIFPELPVHARALVRELVGAEDMRLHQSSLQRRFLYSLLEKFLARASYKEIHTGLVAVVDL